MIGSIIEWARNAIRVRRNPIQFARRLGVTVGDGCRFLGITTSTFGSEPFLISIGNHVTITSGVRFVTHDGGVWVFRPENQDIEVFGPISIGNNVFIGLNSIILPGVTIGNNCVIGAGAVVTRDIPDNSVAVGIPARVVSDITTYKKKVLPKASYIRSMDPEEKRRILNSKYGPVK